MSSRSDTRLRDDLQALNIQSPARKGLNPLKKLGTLASKRGRADWVEPDKPSSSSGIASPLEETQRSYYEPQLVLPSNGYFVIELQSLKQLKMTDADGSPVVINFKEHEK